MGSFSTQKARQVQQRLANLVDEQDHFFNPPQRICGLDVSYLHEEAIGAAVVLNFPGLQLIEQRTIRCQAPIPYIPTLLSFREFPPLSLAFKALQNPPDLCFIDAHGRAHPYKLGAASHFGVLHNVPTIGVAKKILCGTVQTHESKFDEIYLEDELVGARVNSKKGYNPIFVSVGHRVSLPTAIKMTQACITKYKLPEPIRLAHNLATETRRKLIVGDAVE
ncbi:MAG: endonuclease V [Candidatus Hermodarchaeota archaeon]|jgi:deoxyribonuclease V|nr:endonuclease V [Candidatus Hermodarchaeota archaeon]